MAGFSAQNAGTGQLNHERWFALEGFDRKKSWSYFKSKVIKIIVEVWSSKLFLYFPSNRTKGGNTMITGERILEISGKREPGVNIEGMNINIGLEELNVDGENVELKYEYTANYEKNAGFLKIKGTITAKEEKKLADEINEEWKKTKKVPERYAEFLLSAINYSGSANGTLIARVLNLTAPLIPPRISLGKKQ